MVLFDTKKERAALVLGLLAVGLAVAMGPYVSGLLGAPVLYVLFAPLHRLFSKKLPKSLAAGLVIVAASSFLAESISALVAIAGLLVSAAGSIIVGGGLVRSMGVGRWIGVAMLAGVVLAFVGVLGPHDLQAIALVGMALVFGGLGATGLLALRGPAAAS